MDLDHAEKGTLCPELVRNLFSIPAASKNGARVIMTDKACRIFRKHDLLAKGDVFGELYRLKFKPLSAIEAHAAHQERGNDSLPLWHEPLGHAHH